MASSIFFSLSVSFALFLFVSSSLSPEKLHVEVYYETLDANCTGFIANELPKVLHNGHSSRIKFELIPYGRTKTVKGKLVCEHGGNECFLNDVHTCAINETSSTRAVSFISCTEKKILKDHIEDWHFCFQETGLSSNLVANCFFNSTTLYPLQEINAVKTKLAKPQVLPWVVLNGRSLGEDYGNFIAEICKELGTCSAT